MVEHHILQVMVSCLLVSVSVSVATVGKRAAAR